MGLVAFALLIPFAPIIYNMCTALVISLATEYSAFLQEFRNWETAWAVDALYTIVYEMRTLAELVRIDSL